MKPCARLLRLTPPTPGSGEQNNEHSALESNLIQVAMPLLLEPKLVAARELVLVTHIALEPTLLKLRTGGTTRPCKQTGLLK